jgi:DNA-binding transcriptional MerR regulator
MTTDRAMLQKAAERTREYRIGDLGQEFGLTLRALRHYEHVGLLKPRREGIARVYSETDRVCLKSILKARRTGLTLQQIRDRLDAAGPTADLLRPEECLERIEALERRRNELDAAIAELRRLSA